MKYKSDVLVNFIVFKDLEFYHIDMGSQKLYTDGENTVLVRIFDDFFFIVPS